MLTLITLLAVLTNQDLPITPDPRLTPGAINLTINQKNIKKTICVDGYTARTGVRNVPETTKTSVFSEYHINKTISHFEVDHLISLELGGSNDIKNLWPQSYDTKPYNAHLKDTLENKLHSMICTNKISLVAAQKAIATDWVSAYKEYVEGQ